MNNYKVLMKDRCGVRVIIYVTAKSSKDALQAAELERSDCIIEHVKKESESE